VIILLGWASEDALAVPALTRKFDVGCQHCHTIPPELNDFGERFKDHGYRVAGLVEALPEELREQFSQEDPEDLHPAYWPISLRTIAGYRLRSLDHQSTDAGEARIKTRTFGIDRLELVWGGVAAKQASFYVAYRPPLANAAFGERPDQEGELELAWVRFSDLGGKALFNLKLGSLEMDVPVSSRRRLTFSDYPLYRYFPRGSAVADDSDSALNWSDPQLGVELMGYQPSGLRYAVAVINGTNNREDSNTALDYFGRVSHPFRAHRVGAFGYWGTAPTQFQTTALGTQNIVGTGSANQTFYRAGLDGDLRVEPVRLLVIGVYGSDASGLFGGADPQEATFAGALVEVRYDLLKDWDALLIARYDIIRNSAQGDALTPKKTGDLDGVTLAARYTFLATRRLDVVLHGEYSHVQTRLTSVDGNDQNDNRLTVAFDLMM
jgi:hypothetical protein